MRILVLDVGTSSMRATVMDKSGQSLGTEQIKYHPDFIGADTVTQDPSVWVEAMERLCRHAAAAGEVDAVALTSQRSSVIPLGRDGIPLCRAVMWQDKRNYSLCEGLSSYQHMVRSRCGTGISTVFSGGKMLWFRKERPELYQKLQRFVVIPDYLIWHMTGQYVTDHTYGSRSMLMDLKRRQWDPWLLKLFQVEADKLCTLIPPSSVAGYITPDFGRRCGLRTGIPVISCGGDQQCAALGQGVIGPGTVSINLGTGAYLVSAANRIPEDLPEGVLCNASAIPEQYILECSVLPCGAALDWLMRVLGEDQLPSAVTAALKTSPRGGNGAVMLPHLQGTVEQKTEGVRGVFAGLSLSTTRADLIRALLEGICCEVRYWIAQMNQLCPIRTVRVSGGLTRSEEICQLLSDVLGLEVIVQDDGNATTRGAWMAASHCLEMVSDWDSAWHLVAREPQRIFCPDRQAEPFYGRLADCQRELFQATQRLWSKGGENERLSTGPV